MSWTARGKQLVRRLQGRPPLQEVSRALIAKHAPGKRLADVGCLWGVHGAYAFHAVDHGAASVVGIDVTPATPEFLRENAARGNPVRFEQGDVNDPDLLERVGHSDVVFCSGVLYHVPNPVLTLERLRALCRGTLILTSATIPEQRVPQAAVFLPNLDERARQKLRYATGAVKIGLDTPYDAEVSYSNWFWVFTPSCVEAMARTAGFEPLERHVFRRALCMVCR
jgi:2-polyprenyl-3-methyl-5-hydroxy-6-metoxy-1,4-benzoquinol methylase